MGFISFSLDYYADQLNKLYSAPASEASVYTARQLLKMLDDLEDEGYTQLSHKLEETCGGVSRLRGYLSANGAEPFPVIHKPISENDVAYSHDEEELTCAIDGLILRAEKNASVCKDPFLDNIKRFCKWIGYDEDTAYIFLLRDTLLPYIRYRAANREHIHPWLIGRRSFEALTGQENADDEVRACIIGALEHGNCRNYDSFCRHVLPDIRTTLKRYPNAEESLSAMLSRISEKHITVVESGCSGTFPMLLKSLDSRVDIRMYTTYPYLRAAYGDRIYTHKYEENRLFETLYSQDVYFQYSSFRHGGFYVKRCTDEHVEAAALAECRGIMKK